MSNGVVNGMVAGDENAEIIKIILSPTTRLPLMSRLLSKGQPCVPVCSQARINHPFSYNYYVTQHLSYFLLSQSCVELVSRLVASLPVHVQTLQKDTRVHVLFGTSHQAFRFSECAHTLLPAQVPFDHHSGLVLFALPHHAASLVHARSTRNALPITTCLLQDAFCLLKLRYPLNRKRLGYLPNPHYRQRTGNKLPLRLQPTIPTRDKSVPRPRRTRATASSTGKDIDPLEFPPGLENDILYVPTQSLLDSRPGGLPPPEIFEEALDNLLINPYIPQNQNRSLISSSTSSSRPVEPTLGLYCPIEGGDYVLDLNHPRTCVSNELRGTYTRCRAISCRGMGPIWKRYVHTKTTPPGDAQLYFLAASAFQFFRITLYTSPNHPLHLPKAIVIRIQKKCPEDGEASFMFAAPSKMSLALPKTLTIPFSEPRVTLK